MLREAMPSAPTIPYATAPAACGVSVEQDAHHVRVIVPPISNWRMLGGTYMTVLVIIAAVVALHAATFVRDSSRDPQGVIPPLILWSIVLAGWLAYGVVKLHRWRIFTVTAARFSITTRIGSGRGRTVSWPVGNIAHIKRVVASEHMLVRVIGRDWLEFAVSPDPAVTSFVADALDHALHAGLLPVPIPAAQSVKPVQPVHQASPATRAANIFLAVAFAALCLVFPVVMLIAVVASIPLGIWYGTRDREYYF
jgi:hypothetical protein